VSGLVAGLAEAAGPVLVGGLADLAGGYAGMLRVLAALTFLSIVPLLLFKMQRAKRLSEIHLEVDVSVSKQG